MPEPRQRSVSLAAMWDHYRSAVMSPKAPAVQIIETRRAFYAGAESLLRATMAAFDPGDEPTDADLSVMAGIERELLDFAAKVKAGVA